MKKWLVITLLMLTVLSLFAERKAIVIANSNYSKVMLNSPVNDATDMEAALRGVGFNVLRYNNLKLPAMTNAINSFASGLTDQDEVVVYFAGHGTSYEGANYLVPAGVNLSNSQVYRKTAYSVATLAQKVSVAKTSLIVIEASKQWAPDNARAIAKPFVTMTSANPAKQAIIFAARPETVVLNSYAGKSLFTTTFISNITESDQDINQTMNKIITEVATTTRGMQIPWMSNAVGTEFIFNPANSRWRFKAFNLKDIEGGGSISW